MRCTELQCAGHISLHTLAALIYTAEFRTMVNDIHPEIHPIHYFFRWDLEKFLKSISGLSRTSLSFKPH